MNELQRVVSFTAKKVHYGIARLYSSRRTSLCGVAQCFSIESDRSSRERNDWKVPDYDNLPVCIKCEDIALNASIERVNKAHINLLQAEIKVLEIDNEILRTEIRYMELSDGNHSPNFAMPLENEKPVFENYPEIVTYGAINAPTDK